MRSIHNYVFKVNCHESQHTKCTYYGILTELCREQKNLQKELQRSGTHNLKLGQKNQSTECMVILLLLELGSKKKSLNLNDKADF